MDKERKNAFVHLSALFTSILGPLLAYLLTDDEDIKEHAKESLNWQITLIIYTIISGILSIVIIGLLTALLAMLANILFCVKGAISASNGDLWSYPITYSFL